jgi:peptide methionine sulfoxide reductase MsrB
MIQVNEQDEYWKNKLSKGAYESLRLGIMEEPNTGVYVAMNKKGVYHCAGCRSPLFDSSKKVESKSGYATFSLTLSEVGEQNILISSDEENGLHKVVCAVCGGVLGFVDSKENADFLGEGKKCQLLHCSSNVLSFKKSFTLRNYPFWYGVLVISIIVVGLGVCSTVSTMLKPDGAMNGVVHVLVGDTDIATTVIRLDVIDPENQSLVFGHDALFIVLSKSEKSPRLKLSKQPVDVLWINETFSVVSFERGVTPEAGGVLQAPEDASFALVSRAGLLQTTVFVKDTKVYVADKTKLQ